MVASGVCSAGCQPIVSVEMEGMPCARNGVFFGCAPDVWNSNFNLAEGFCDIAVKDEPNFVYYCFKGGAAVLWRAHHPETFCSTAPCNGEIVDNCMDPY